MSSVSPSVPVFAPAGDPGAAESGRSVFINCPYDPQYEPLFDALVFTIVSCGFFPRSATDSGTISVSRMDRIFGAIYESSYSIHDLSRCQGEGEQMLARFNMPLELGIAMSRRRHGTPGNGHHDWLVLVPENASYARFVSDLTGFDLVKYDGNPDTLVKKVMSWLVSRPGALPGARPGAVLAKLDSFRRRKAELKQEWSEIPWRHLVQAATELAAQS